MQTLTIPASVSKRKQACRSCRQRKRKCDAERPVCSSCKKLGTKCDYAAQSFHSGPAHHSHTQEVLLPMHSAGDLASEPGHRETLDFMQFSGTNFDLHTLPPPTHADPPNGEPSPDFGQRTMLMDNAIDLPQDILADFQLPDGELLIELVRLFFRHLYHMFPCFHKQSFLTNVENGHFQKEAPLLLYAICCISSRHHPDIAVRKRQADWYEQAKFSYEITRRFPHQHLRTIQAVLLLVYHAFTIGDFSASWLFLGKAWRQAAAIGMNRLDAGQGSTSGLEKMSGLDRSRDKTAVEKEEYRRTLWLLFIMDRNHAWPTGWPNAINDLQFKIDIPVADTLFQDLDPDTMISPYTNTACTRNLNRVVQSLSGAKEPLNLFHYISVAHVLLGRVSELIHSLHDKPDTPEFAEECQELDSSIVKFRLSLPRHATSVIEAAPEERAHVVWLNVILNVVAILLYYRCADGVLVPDGSRYYTLAIAAAQNTAQIIKDAARFSIDLLMSGHIGSSLYIAAYVLVIQWHATGDGNLKDDIDLFALVFERMNEVFVFMGLKFKLALERDIQMSKEDVTSLKELGFKGLLADCTQKWEFLRAEVQRRGINIDIS